jgi:hypothetical protein
MHKRHGNIQVGSKFGWIRPYIGPKRIVNLHILPQDSYILIAPKRYRIAHKIDLLSPSEISRLKFLTV